MLAKKNPTFNQVVGLVKEFSADEQVRAEYEQHRLWRMDYSASMRNAAEIGRKEGIAESERRGKAEGKQDRSREIALVMKSKGYSVQDIADLTGLTKKEIESL